MATITKISNANLYIDGTNWAGRMEEFQVPDITTMMVEHKALGMYGAIELPAGFDKMEGKMTILSVDQEHFLKLGNPMQPRQYMLRGNQDIHTSEGVESVPYVVFMTASAKKLPGGTFKQNESPKFEVDINITALKIEINGADVYEFDAMANVFKVGGADQLAAFRANVGL